MNSKLLLASVSSVLLTAGLTRVAEMADPHRSPMISSEKLIENASVFCTHNCCLPTE